VTNPLSFDTIRPWNGSQSRAFEEISFQVLKDDVPEGCTVIRTGNPDGGVEWYTTLPNGEEWGWQAKFTHNIGSLLNGMTKSVKQVVVERPKLVRMSFVISSNLSTGSSGNTNKSQRQRYEDKISFWKQKVAGADRYRRASYWIDFRYTNTEGNNGSGGIKPSSIKNGFSSFKSNKRRLQGKDIDQIFRLISPYRGISRALVWRSFSMKSLRNSAIDWPNRI
jgi:hypothetical protein